MVKDERCLSKLNCVTYKKKIKKKIELCYSESC